MLFCLQVETLDEDMVFLKDILRLPNTHNFRDSSFDAPDNLVDATTDHVHTGDLDSWSHAPDYFRTLDDATTDHVHTGDPEIRMQTESIHKNTQLFIRSNQSPSTYKTAEQYFAMLTHTERQLIYTAYYQDYLLFGYEPHL